MPRLLIGTANRSKFPYLAGYLDGTGIECVGPAELGLTGFDAKEDKLTAEDNAIQKALSWHEASGLPVFALDAGLVFLDLPEDHPDQPGVHVRRANGHVMDDEEMLAWFADLAHRHGGRLRAAWQDSYCLLKDAEHYQCFTFDRDALAHYAFWLVDKPVEARLPGWPLNSITADLATGKCPLEMTAEEQKQAAERTDAQRAAHHQKLRAWIQETAVRMLEQD